MNDMMVVVTEMQSQEHIPNPLANEALHAPHAFRHLLSISLARKDRNLSLQIILVTINLCLLQSFPDSGIHCWG